LHLISNGHNQAYHKVGRAFPELKGIIPCGLITPARWLDSGDQYHQTARRSIEPSTDMRGSRKLQRRLVGHMLHPHRDCISLATMWKRTRALHARNSQFECLCEGWQQHREHKLWERAGTWIVDGYAILRPPISTPYARTITACRNILAAPIVDKYLGT
jgi:hypothetical protein